MRLYNLRTDQLTSGKLNHSAKIFKFMLFSNQDSKTNPRPVRSCFASLTSFISSVDASGQSLKLYVRYSIIKTETVTKMNNMWKGNQLSIMFPQSDCTVIIPINLDTHIAEIKDKTRSHSTIFFMVNVDNKINLVTIGTRSSGIFSVDWRVGNFRSNWKIGGMMSQWKALYLKVSSLTIAFLRSLTDRTVLAALGTSEQIQGKTRHNGHSVAYLK